MRPIAEPRRKGPLLDPIDKQTRALQLQADAIDHRSIADRVSQAVAQDLGITGQKITADEKQRQLDLTARIAGGGQTAQDQQQIARINALGELATVSDKMRAKQLELNNANREGLGITTSQQAALVRLTEAQEVATRTSAKSSAGIADTSDIQKTLNLQRSSLIDRGLLDPSDPVKMAQANVVLPKLRADERRGDRARPARELEEARDRSASLRGQLDSHRDDVAEQLDDQPGRHHYGHVKRRATPSRTSARRSCAPLRKR